MRGAPSGRTLAWLMAALLSSGCSGLLEVSSDNAIAESDLTGDERTIAMMADGVQGEFRREYAWLAAHGAMFTDEAIQGHPWAPWNAYDARAVPPDSPAYDGLSYQLLQRARGTADELIPRIETLVRDRAPTSLPLARAYAYGGYSYILLADHLCEAPVNVSAPVPALQLYGVAAQRLERAVQIASAAQPRPGSDELLHLARVGLARAALNAGDRPRAIAHASQVPAEFTAWVRYAPDAADWQVYNFLHWFAGYRVAGELDLALDPKMRDLADRRIPFDGTPRRLGNGLRDGLLPYQPSSYSEWSPGGTTMFGESTSIRFASGLEARYILAEAGAFSSAALRAFVDERRRAGGLGPFVGNDAQLFAELLEQRFRDFFLDGHRIGDLRRYKRLYAIDLWPKGTMPGLTQQYGSQECWPIAASERASNPNIPK